MPPHFILPLSLDSILSDVGRAVEAKLYYPALLVALTIPEICAALELPNSIFVKEKHYVDFVDKYTTPRELGLSGVDCYRLRGGVIHRASFARHPKFGATHVIFTIPESGSSVHAISMEMGGKIADMLDLVSFTTTMVGAARKWFWDHRNDKTVEENLEHIIRYCPFGLSPFLGGAPVVGSGP